MPTFIKTKEDEARWSKAKDVASKSKKKDEATFTDQDWGLVKSIYHNMKKSELSKSGVEGIVDRINFIKDLIKSSSESLDFNPDMLEKTKETIAKAFDYDDRDGGGDDDHGGGSSNEDDDSDYSNDFQNYDLGDDDLKSLKVTEDPFQDDEDEAGNWLKEQESGGKAKPTPPAKDDDEVKSPVKENIPEKAARSSAYTDWSPHGQYTPEQKKIMEEHQKLGYSPREAERLAGASKSPKDFQSALSHTVRPSQPSPKMLNELRELAGHWLDRADRHAKLNADPEKNPQKFASGKMMQAHEAGTKDYNKAYNDFLSSDEVKGKKGLDRHKAIQTWKQSWKTQNPDYHEKLVTGMSEAGKHFGEANKVRAQNLNDIMTHIMTGGQQEGSMSASEAAQHVGGAKEDEGYSSSVIKDPSASFAHNNPQLVEKLRQRLQPDQFDRYQRVQSARAIQGASPKVIRRPKPGGGGSSSSSSSTPPATGGGEQGGGE